MHHGSQLKRFLLFALIPLAIFAAVLIYPFIQGLYLTFTNWDGFAHTKYVGFANYAKSLKDPEFWSTLRFTLKYVLVSLVAINAVAFGLALLVTAKLKSSNLFRTFFFVPNLIGGVVLGVIWQFIFNTAPSLSQARWDGHSSNPLGLEIPIQLSGHLSL
jgi:raffinose/stachyose/melibiose transport system permease protein